MAGKKTRDELIDILNLVVDKVTSNLNIDEILLYGSYAKGKEYEPYISHSAPFGRKFIKTFQMQL
jgi:hypothetical protein